MGHDHREAEQGMPRIFDNIEAQLVGALRETLASSHSADYCVGYFNLRGWKDLDDCVECWPGGPGNQCRLLIGMQTPAEEEVRRLFSLAQGDSRIDQAEAHRLRPEDGGRLQSPAYVRCADECR
jgi:hypothetical protein